MSVEQAGYDAWVDHWVRTEYCPSPFDCPARFMKADSERSGFLRGWLKARSEFMEENQPQPRPPQAV